MDSHVGRVDLQVSFLTGSITEEAEKMMLAVTVRAGTVCVYYTFKSLHQYLAYYHDECLGTSVDLKICCGLISRDT